MWHNFITYLVTKVGSKKLLVRKGTQFGVQGAGRRADLKSIPLQHGCGASGKASHHEACAAATAAAAVASAGFRLLLRENYDEINDAQLPARSCRSCMDFCG